MEVQNWTATVLPTTVKHLSMVSFSWYDYILFCLMLSLSALIGVYFGCFGTKQSSADEYLMGNKKMKVFPISVSLVASHISGITLLALPADIYKFGAAYWLFFLALLIVAIVTIYVYLPVFYKLQLTSSYEYLERRFDNRTRMFASFLFGLGQLLYLPIVIYIPALALSAATGISVHYITPVVCGVCIFYTTLGGLKAVVWTDTLQFSVTIGAVVTVLILGLRSAGGFANVWTIASQGHRLDIFDFDPDPTKRESFWIITIGLSFYWLSFCGTHQSCIQKFLSVSTLRESKMSVIYFAIGISVIVSFSVFTGLIMYAKYADCDPFLTGIVEKSDQMLPYYIMDVASHIPGLSGLFVAGVFSAALSTLSASLNCLGGTIYEDFILKFTGKMHDGKGSSYILKVIVVIMGVTCTLLVYVFESLGGMLPLAIGLGGVTAGPVLGMFTLGILFPRASSKGVFYGAVIGLLVPSWVVVMAQYYQLQGTFSYPSKPTSVDGCVANVTEHSDLLITECINCEFSTYSQEVIDYATTNTAYEDITADIELAYLKTDEQFKPFFLFRISFYYYTALGTLVTMICGLAISYSITNDDQPVHKDLLSPSIYYFLSDDRSSAENKEYYNLHKVIHLVAVNSEKEKI